jgi:hypothetical protein
LPHQKRLNVTKGVRKVPIDLSLQRTGAAMDDTTKKKPKYDDEGTHVRARQPVLGLNLALHQ